MVIYLYYVYLYYSIQSLFIKDNQNVSIRDVICGPTATAIILSNNTAFTFGSNWNGQLGHGHRNDVLIPTLLNPDSDTTQLRHDQIATIKLSKNCQRLGQGCHDGSE